MNNLEENSLYNFLLDRIPILGETELVIKLKDFSGVLEKYLSKTVGERQSFRSSLNNCIREIYDIINTKYGNSIQSNTQKSNLGFKPMRNTLNSNGLEKSVYYTNSRIIKKNKYSKEDNKPFLLFESIINIILEYNCVIHGKDYVPKFIGLSKVIENNRNQRKTENWNYEMEKIQGITLQKYILSKEFRFPIFINILYQIVEILRFLQRTCGFFHGDLNTSNVMLILLEDGSYKVKLIDFGFSLIDTNYLNNKSKYVLTNTRSLNTDLLRIGFTANKNINTVSKKDLLYMDFYHLLFFIYKDFKTKRSTDILNKIILAFKVPKDKLNRIRENQIHSSLRQFNFINIEAFESEIENLIGNFDSLNTGVNANANANANAYTNANAKANLNANVNNVNNVNNVKNKRFMRFRNLGKLGFESNDENNNELNFGEFGNAAALRTSISSQSPRGKKRGSIQNKGPRVKISSPERKQTSTRQIFPNNSNNE